MPRPQHLPRAIRGVALGAILAACSDAAAPPPVASISIAASAGAIRVGDSVGLAATIRDDRGGVLPARAVTWRSETPETATIVGSRLVAQAAGPARVVAAVDGVEGRATFTVRSRPVASIVVEPSPLDLLAADSVLLQITLRDAAGRLVPDVTPSLSVYDPLAAGIARVASQRWLHAVAGGEGEIVVRAEGVRVTTSLLVRERPLVGLRAMRRSIVAEVGACFANGLVGRTVDGRELSIGGVMVPKDGAVVRHSGANLVECGLGLFAVAPGTTTLEAALGSLTTTVPVTIVPPAASEFDIAIRWVGAEHPAVRASLVAAIARWRRVVLGDLPDQRLAIPAGGCFPGSPAIDELVDDILVFVYAGPLDGEGGALARAGPCATRDDSGLPIAGIVMIDAADVAAVQSASPRIERVLMHEFGHVLGIGTLWDAHLGAHLGDPRFTGPRARLASGDFGYLDHEREGIPVETGGGGSTAGAHWRESVFDDELMTGWLFDHDRLRLSGMTIGVLADLGFEVSMAAADVVSPRPPRPFFGPGPVARREGASRGGGVVLDERPRRPTFRIRGDGTPTRAAP